MDPLLIDVTEVTTAFRQYLKLRWVDAQEVNRVTPNEEKKLEARYWNNDVGYFELNGELQALIEGRAPAITYRVVKTENLPELEDDEWRKFNRVYSKRI